jgi:hypothetical protein
VSVNTHKGFALEILMTMAHVALSYHVLLWVFTLCLNSCNTLFAQFRLIWIGSILFGGLYIAHSNLGSIRHVDHVFSK